MGESVVNSHLDRIAAQLAAVARLVQRISDEVGPGTVRGAQTVIERYRPEVYAAMEAVGLAVHEFVQTGPSPERLAEAQALVIGKLREISLTSPIALYGTRSKRRPMSYFEVVEHVRAGRMAGADVPARVLDDYYTHTRIGQAFLNRLALFNERLLAEVEHCRESESRPLPVVSLQYVGGELLLRLASDPDRLDGVQVTCIDSNSAAVRHAEQTLRPAFGSRIQILLADPAKWLQGPAYPAATACVVYAVSLLEQLPARRVVKVLQGAYRVLRPGGVLLLGSTAGDVPLGERMIRDWLLGWDWTYRTESEWRDLFAQTPFGAASLTFEYEPLATNALIRVAKEV